MYLNLVPAFVVCYLYKKVATFHSVTFFACPIFPISSLMALVIFSGFNAFILLDKKFIITLNSSFFLFSCCLSLYFPNQKVDSIFFFPFLIFYYVPIAIFTSSLPATLCPAHFQILCHFLPSLLQSHPSVPNPPSYRKPF